MSHYIVLLILLLVCFQGCSNNQTPLVITNQEPAIPTVEERKLRPYKIVHIDKTLRYDGGTELFVLIDPVDLSNDQFKQDIKELTNQLVAEYGPKTGIEFHDNIKSLEIAYNDETGKKSPSKADDIFSRTHYIAAFSGDLETGPYLNTLWFFLATDTQDNPELAKYIGMVEYNPPE